MIDSSPNKAAPTGADGLMRSRAGGDAGFEVCISLYKSLSNITDMRLVQLDDARVVRLTEMVRQLRVGADILEEQIAHSDTRFLTNAERAIAPTIKWVSKIEEELHRRTMPHTNATVRGDRGLGDMIGYRFPSVLYSLQTYYSN